MLAYRYLSKQRAINPVGSTEITEVAQQVALTAGGGLGALSLIATISTDLAALIVLSTMSVICFSAAGFLNSRSAGSNGTASNREGLVTTYLDAGGCSGYLGSGRSCPVAVNCRNRAGSIDVGARGNKGWHLMTPRKGGPCPVWWTPG